MLRTSNPKQSRRVRTAEYFRILHPRPDPGQQTIFEPNERLYEFPAPQFGPPALGFGNNLGGGYRPGECIGITLWNDNVWTSFAGSIDSGDPSPLPDTNESAIWSSRIEFGP